MSPSEQAAYDRKGEELAIKAMPIGDVLREILLRLRTAPACSCQTMACTDFRAWVNQLGSASSSSYLQTYVTNQRPSKGSE